MILIFNDICYKSWISHTKELSRLPLVTFMIYKSNCLPLPLYNICKIRYLLNSTLVIVVEATTLPINAVFSLLNAEPVAKLATLPRSVVVNPRRPTKGNFKKTSINSVVPNHTLSLATHSPLLSNGQDDATPCLPYLEKPSLLL